ncbi:MAG: 2-oxoglutarate oxidoreductase [Spirochaetes bacterium GWD1_61_31]|nr:MAG: 2-oxoglutarate oxidoreductase [Spirochaetes bacterium GWB1_60_80]OHD29307.1 MAG: 2-oxoglutarate oxidoreductase [Spirochaetes bacterium GWC1_61_12]OHD35815.1 MAG: 2-oxoglutarate oxidoreductase [Spirochaetes bacterium GWD1_61_31]OHD46756.1 MAG: 2-oxoglutarate oxidoreductase [Spirochaetes bacterium GWE1_60_18]OHD61208.1 MAG: 2-oxoglutarate oxidoreductase [Spirochaetes bacterium GWF1_60_12]HAP43035.1 2-oxoglutarate oxidoreductase [Spirochaetaceae bacterium]
MELLYGHPKSLNPVQTKYCPGCGHGTIHRLICEVIDELGVQERSIITNPVGCSIWSDLYFNFDSVQPPHGRTPAAATGVKRMLPDHLVICYQGDGDLAAIGTAEIIHAANRGEKFTTIFVNNAIYGMTGGQMAPTTLIGQKASTAPYGRDATGEAGMGYPMQVCEILATLGGTKYLARGSVNTPANVRKTKQYIKKAFEAQMRGEGFTMVEILSPCPTNWGLGPCEAEDWLEQNMIPFYKLGEVKNTLDAAAIGGAK